MNTLVQERCVACRADSPRVTEQELKELMPQIPDWQIIEREGVPQLERTYKLKDFASALALTQRIGQLAEEQDHHPKLCTEWGKVTVTWWTHAIKGLHRNDLIMAAKSDEVYRSLGSPSK